MLLLLLLLMCILRLYRLGLRVLLAIQLLVLREYVGEALFGPVEWIEDILVI